MYVYDLYFFLKKYSYRFFILFLTQILSDNGERDLILAPFHDSLVYIGGFVSDGRTLFLLHGYPLPGSQEVTTDDVALASVGGPSSPNQTRSPHSLADYNDPPQKKKKKKKRDNEKN